MRKLAIGCVAAFAAITLTACEGDTHDGFDPALDCDMALVAGARAELNEGKVSDRNGDGLVVLCLDPAAAATLFPG